tara:strand:- start:8032 stop:8382 length:351 start_codon:yes stop_codon:yes gene_type:complete
MGAVINVGLDYRTHDGTTGRLARREVLDAVKRHRGVIADVQSVQSDSEPTLVITLVRPMAHRTLERLSADLRQDAIAQFDGSSGHLAGPRAEDWGPFNPEFFFMPDGQRLAQSQAA